MRKTKKYHRKKVERDRKELANTREGQPKKDEMVNVSEINTAQQQQQQNGWKTVKERTSWNQFNF